MKELIILVANIGGGKSTITKKYQKNGYIVISRDTLRYAIGGGNYIFNYDHESIIFRTEFYMLEAFMEIGANIVVDEVNINKLMRLRYINLAKDYGYKVKCHLLPKLTMKESVNRRIKCPHGDYTRKVWENIWKNFNNQYEKPTLSEGFDEIIKGE